MANSTIGKGKAIKVGSWQLGFQMMTVYAQPGVNHGCYSLCDGDMHIGLKQPTEYHLMNVLMHETIEAVASQMGLRFNRTPAFNEGSDRFVFIFDHQQFSELCERSSYFVASAMAKLRPIWKAELKKSTKH